MVNSIAGLCVCVDYAPFFERTIDMWSRTLDTIVVVTTPEDALGDTGDLLRRYPQVRMFVTSVFTANGALFNKAAAMDDALFMVPWDDWVLFFDVDILPPADWRLQFESADPQPGLLYGARRIQHDTMREFKDWGISGWFQMFHSSDPRVQERPLLYRGMKHAGIYDQYFQDKWAYRGDMTHKIRLPIGMIHLDTPGVNWAGRSPERRKELKRLERLRRESGTYDADHLKEKTNGDDI